MIHYIVKGPSQTLEIHHDRLKVIRKGILYYIGLGARVQEWPLSNIANFSVTKKFLTGQIYWKTYQGESNGFKYSDQEEFVSKIHAYIQKVILKNNKRQNSPPVEVTKLPAVSCSVAA